MTPHQEQQQTPPRRIIALDPANATGWAHSGGDFGTHMLVVDPKTDHPGDRLCRIQNLIYRLSEEIGGVDLIAWETAAMGARNFRTVQSHAELAGAIKLTARRLGAEVVAYSPTQIKAYATGSTRADKAGMIRAAELQLGKRPRDDNQADALWILEMARNGYQTKTKPKPRKRKPRQAGRKPQNLF